MASPEHAPHGPETAEKPHAHSPERAPEILDRKAEQAPESREEVEKNIEKARTEATQEALSGREVSKGEQKKDSEPTAHVTPRSRDESYKHTMKSIRSEMSAPARTFSKVIHNPVVERTSEVVGSTVARPNAILSGSIFACLFVLGLYLLARNNGFALSGFETIATFLVGWAFGIVFDLLRGMFTGKRL